ncbi:MAG TPA: hypothetical protein VJ438_04965 [Candidatus Nanoarchaeia archaeon]|nr:hypothetical protein [Candidatus Nanoarchaeia archaeon]
MPQQDTSDIKERIVTFLKIRGPSLPVHIAKEINMSMLFTSAFLSELISERRIKISYMKIGSSSLNFIEGQEHRLEAFAQHLKSREKDAFEIIKEKRILKDSEQEPAIRVALRAIKDFAIPFKKNDEIFWRYFTVPESELIIETKAEEKKEVPSVKEENKIDIFDTPKKEEKNEKPKKKTSKKKSPSSKKKNERFFDVVKEFLSKKNIEIIGVEGVSKLDLALKIRVGEEEKMLIAYNKKKISESDIANAFKKSSESGLKYMVLSLGEPSKKLLGLIDAIKNLSSIKKIE